MFLSPNFFLGASVKDVDMSATPLVAKAEEDLVEIWPLHLINVDDEEHFELAFKLLSRVPAVIHHYLTGRQPPSPLLSFPAL
jgi:hypothetical protein